MSWSTVLLDDLLGNAVGEVAKPYDRRISFRMRRLATQSFRVRLDDPLADPLLEGRVLAKTYEGIEGAWDLRFVGDVVTAEEKGSESDKRVEVACADPFGRLSRRLIGKYQGGFSRPVAQDRGLTVFELLAQANAEGDTGIRQGTLEGSASDIAGPWAFKPFAETVAELAAPLDGFDWRMRAVEPFLDSAGYPHPRPVVGYLDIAPFFGALRPDAIFEYGTGRKNVRDYNRAVTKEGLANAAYSLPPGYPESAYPTAEQLAAGQIPLNVQSNSDPVAADEWGLNEVVVPSDVTSDDLRAQLAIAHVQIRKTPRQIITFDPVREDVGVQVPQFKQDYDVGDLVPFRAINPETGSVRVDAVMRIYGVDVSIESEGQEQMTLTLVEES